MNKQKFIDNMKISKIEEIYNATLQTQYKGNFLGWEVKLVKYHDEYYKTKFQRYTGLESRSAAINIMYNLAINKDKDVVA